MIAEYQRARDELDAGLPAGSKFRVKVLGGTWTSRNKHVGYDAYRGEPINAVAEAWGVQYTMGRSARFAISLYTDRGAAMLARIYVEKCHYYYEIYLNSEDLFYSYTDADFGGYIMPPEFFDLFATRTQQDAINRMLWLQDLRPM